MPFRPWRYREAAPRRLSHVAKFLDNIYLLILSEMKREVKRKRGRVADLVPNWEYRDSPSGEHIEQGQKKTSFDALIGAGSVL